MHIKKLICNNEWPESIFLYYKNNKKHVKKFEDNKTGGPDACPREVMMVLLF